MNQAGPIIALRGLVVDRICIKSKICGKDRFFDQ